jgi:hypothetical protein
MLVLDQPIDLDRAFVAVELRDSALADGRSTVIASTRGRKSGRGVRTIEFSMDADVERDGVYTLGAEVRRGAKLAPGDLLNVASHPWRARDANPVVIEIKPIV